jgi:hypothetical protein
VVYAAATQSLAALEILAHTAALGDELRGARDRGARRSHDRRECAAAIWRVGTWPARGPPATAGSRTGPHRGAAGSLESRPGRSHLRHQSRAPRLPAFAHRPAGTLPFRRAAARAVGRNSVIKLACSRASAPTRSHVPARPVAQVRRAIPSSCPDRVPLTRSRSPTPAASWGSGHNRANSYSNVLHAVLVRSNRT